MLNAPALIDKDGSTLPVAWKLEALAELRSMRILYPLETLPKMAAAILLWEHKRQIL